STRRVCRYDPDGGHDGHLSNRPDFIVDPSDRQPGDPCRVLLQVDYSRLTSGIQLSTCDQRLR
ncbi:MAG TPA: hypothetical protein VMA72_06205, partial [Streptosporangiaceae bacterium]|nr:hypothetical protein [Streptosporangiaceae bacterium]